MEWLLLKRLGKGKITCPLKLKNSLIVHETTSTICKIFFRYYLGKGKTTLKQQTRKMDETESMFEVLAEIYLAQ